MAPILLLFSTSLFILGQAVQVDRLTAWDESHQVFQESTFSQHLPDVLGAIIDETYQSFVYQSHPVAPIKRMDSFFPNVTFKESDGVFSRFKTRNTANNPQALSNIYLILGTEATRVQMSFTYQGECGLREYLLSPEGQVEAKTEIKNLAVEGKFETEIWILYERSRYDQQYQDGTQIMWFIPHECTLTPIEASRYIRISREEAKQLGSFKLFQ